MSKSKSKVILDDVSMSFPAGQVSAILVSFLYYFEGYLLIIRAHPELVNLPYSNFSLPDH